MDYLSRYNFWCTDGYFDEQTKSELLSIQGNDKEIEDRFYKELSFGTGGLRGVIGNGTNRMNIYTVRKATQGLANFIIKENGQEKGVAIAYDSRRFSPEFSMEAALCLCANGIKTYLFDSLRPTPELSYAVRRLHCVAGIVVTASHNPADYNGYKVYWEDGAQITYPKDEQIITEVNQVSSYHMVKTMQEKAAKEAGLLSMIGEEIDDGYMEELKKLVLNPEAIMEQADKLKIVYTPLHGTGNIPVRRVLRELGFKNVYVVPEQELPDENFSTISYPNPEDKAAFRMALELAEKVEADIVLATDPDADRLGVYVKDSKSGEYIAFTGNMSGMLIAEYLLSEMKRKGCLPKNGALVKTIVTTNMSRAITKEYDIPLIEVLTGFKYIGEQIKLFEENNTYQYIFGLEESYGCLEGTYARDKDAVVAVMALCEAAAFYQTKGLTLWDQMNVMYKTYGFYAEDLHSITLKGIDGVEKISKMMTDLRENPPASLGNWKVMRVRDYLNHTISDMVTNSITDTGLPESNVLYFDLDQDAWCCVRPSGTEPKIKFYMGVKGNSIKDSRELLEKLKVALLDLG